MTNLRLSKIAELGNEIYFLETLVCQVPFPFIHLVLPLYLSSFTLLYLLHPEIVAPTGRGFFVFVLILCKTAFKLVAT